MDPILNCFWDENTLLNLLWTQLLKLFKYCLCIVLFQGIPFELEPLILSVNIMDSTIGFDHPARVSHANQSDGRIIFESFIVFRNKTLWEGVNHIR